MTTKLNPVIQTSFPIGLVKGDTLSIQVPDHRRWPRFKAWFLGRAKPTKTEYFVITQEITATQLEVTPCVGPYIAAPQRTKPQT